MKTCIKCGESKELSEFYKRSNGRYQEACKPCYRARIQASRDADRPSHRRKYNYWNAERKARIREAVFAAYGGYVCACCGETERKFLTLDHIENDGAAHRLKIAGKRTASGWTTYLWAFNNAFPTGLQVLCMNCNFGKRMNNGVCPHKARSNDYPQGVEPIGSKRSAPILSLVKGSDEDIVSSGVKAPAAASGGGS